MSEGKRKVFIIIVLLLVVIFGFGQFFAYSNLGQQSSSSSQNNNEPPTQVIDYSPLPPASSTPIEKGSCFASSIAAPYRSDAWRCSVGNAISDPCFEIQGSTSTLACGQNPAGTDTSLTFTLQLTKPLPKPTIIQGVAPSNWGWLVELGDGTVCSPYTGTRPFTATGEIAAYSCNSAQPGEDMIFGDLNSSSSVWTAEVGSLSTSTTKFPPVIAASATVPIFAVWQ
jgi:hypothetical protein